MAIKDADGVIIPSHVAQLESGSAKFLVTFTPATKGPHTVNITFNKEVLKSKIFISFKMLITYSQSEVIFNQKTIKKKINRKKNISIVFPQRKHVK